MNSKEAATGRVRGADPRRGDRGALGVNHHASAGSASRGIAPCSDVEKEAQDRPGDGDACRKEEPTDSYYYYSYSSDELPTFAGSAQLAVQDSAHIWQPRFSAPHKIEGEIYLPDCFFPEFYEPEDVAGATSNTTLRYYKAHQYLEDDFSLCDDPNKPWFYANWCMRAYNRHFPVTPYPVLIIRGPCGDPDNSLTPGESKASEVLHFLARKYERREYQMKSVAFLLAQHLGAALKYTQATLKDIREEVHRLSRLNAQRLGEDAVRGPTLSADDVLRMQKCREIRGNVGEYFDQIEGGCSDSVERAVEGDKTALSEDQNSVLTNAAVQDPFPTMGSIAADASPLPRSFPRLHMHAGMYIRDPELAEHATLCARIMDFDELDDIGPGHLALDFYEAEAFITNKSTGLMYPRGKPEYPEYAVADGIALSLVTKAGELRNLIVQAPGKRATVYETLEGLTDYLTCRNSPHPGSSRPRPPKFSTVREKFGSHSLDEDFPGTCSVCSVSFDSYAAHVASQPHLDRYKALLDRPFWGFNREAFYKEHDMKMCRSCSESCRKYLLRTMRESARKNAISAQLSLLTAGIAEREGVDYKLAAEAMTKACYQTGLPLRVDANDLPARATSPTLRRADLSVWLSDIRRCRAQALELDLERIVQKRENGSEDPPVDRQGNRSGTDPPPQKIDYTRYFADLSAQLSAIAYAAGWPLTPSDGAPTRVALKEIHAMLRPVELVPDKVVERCRELQDRELQGLANFCMLCMRVRNGDAEKHQEPQTTPCPFPSPESDSPPPLVLTVPELHALEADIKRLEIRVVDNRSRVMLRLGVFLYSCLRDLFVQRLGDYSPMRYRELLGRSSGSPASSDGQKVGHRLKNGSHGSSSMLDSQPFRILLGDSVAPPELLKPLPSSLDEESERAWEGAVSFCKDCLADEFVSRMLYQSVEDIMSRFDPDPGVRSATDGSYPESLFDLAAGRDLANVSSLPNPSIGSLAQSYKNNLVLPNSIPGPVVLNTSSVSLQLMQQDKGLQGDWCSESDSLDILNSEPCITGPCRDTASCPQEGTNSCIAHGSLKSALSSSPNTLAAVVSAVLPPTAGSALSSPSLLMAQAYGDAALGYNPLGGLGLDSAALLSLRASQETRARLRGLAAEGREEYLSDSGTLLRYSVLN